MHFEPSVLTPTKIFGGCIAVYEGAWENPQQTIDAVVSITSDTSSDIQFRPSKTVPEYESQEESGRTSSGFSITKHAKVNETIKTVNDKCYNLISLAVKNYIENFEIGEEIKHSEPYNIIRYSEGQHYVSHYDGGTGSARSISVLVYLNDDYDGGEIEFPNFQLKIKPKAGTLILFPSNYAYSHIAHKVVSGTKYAIVTFLHDR